MAIDAGATYRDTAFTVASSAVIEHSRIGHPGRSLFSFAPGVA